MKIRPTPSDIGFWVKDRIRVLGFQVRIYKGLRCSALLLPIVSCSFFSKSCQAYYTHRKAFRRRYDYYEHLRVLMYDSRPHKPCSSYQGPYCSECQRFCSLFLNPPRLSRRSSLGMPHGTRSRFCLRWRGHQYRGMPGCRVVGLELGIAILLRTQRILYSECSLLLVIGDSRSCPSTVVFLDRNFGSGFS